MNTKPTSVTGGRFTNHILGVKADGTPSVTSSKFKFPPAGPKMDPNLHIVESPEGLRVFDLPTLVKLYNHILPKKQHVDGFPDLETAIDALWTKLCQSKRDSDEPPPGTEPAAEAATTESTEASTEENSTMATNGKTKVSRGKGPQKAAKKTAKKATGEKKPGVISTIVDILKNGGGTAEQIADKLAKKFPDRKRDGMLTTVKIQLTRLVDAGKVKKIHKEEVEGKPIKYSAS
jgi:hypothetical protein